MPLTHGCQQIGQDQAARLALKLIVGLARDQRGSQQRADAGNAIEATWRVVAKDAAALGADPAEVSIALRMALSLEGVEYRPK